MRWALLPLLLAGCITPPPPGTPAPILCNPIPLPAARELAAMPDTSALKWWIVFTDRGTCRSNQDMRETMGFEIPEDMRRGPVK